MSDSEAALTLGQSQQHAAATVIMMLEEASAVLPQCESTDTQSAEVPARPPPPARPPARDRHGPVSSGACRPCPSRWVIT